MLHIRPVKEVRCFVLLEETSEPYREPVVETVWFIFQVEAQEAQCNATGILRHDRVAGVHVRRIVHRIVLRLDQS